MSECPLRTDTELLTRLTSHNPLIPLPMRSWPNRNPKIAHAPKRNHGLSAEGKQVSAFLLPRTRQQQREKTRPYLFYTLLRPTKLKAKGSSRPNSKAAQLFCALHSIWKWFKKSDFKYMHLILLVISWLKNETHFVLIPNTVFHKKSFTQRVALGL